MKRGRNGERELGERRRKEKGRERGKRSLFILLTPTRPSPLCPPSPFVPPHRLSPLPIVSFSPPPFSLPFFLSPFFLSPSFLSPFSLHLFFPLFRPHFLSPFPSSFSLPIFRPLFLSLLRLPLSQVPDTSTGTGTW